MGSWVLEEPLTIVAADEHCRVFVSCPATGLGTADPTSNAAISRVGNTTHGPSWPVTTLLLIAIIVTVKQ
jgi:hypothetical protein